MILFIFLLLPSTGHGQPKEWKLEKEAEGIKIFTREVESISIKEFKGQSAISSSAETVIAILKDVEHYPLWIEDVEASRVLAVGSGLNFYYELHLPWPVKNRDVAMAMKISSKPDASTLLELTSIADKVEPYPDLIRIKNVIGYWHVKAITEQRCEVTYQFLADPEGMLPGWVVNLFIVDGPFKTLQNLEAYAVNKM